MEKTKPYGFSGDYSHLGRFRAALCALLFVLAVITAVCVHASLQWVGEPFNGFLMGENRIVAPIDLPSWTGRAANIPYWWQLVSIDGRSIETTRQALDAAIAAGDGSVLVYGFSDGETTVEIPVRVMTFKVADWVGLFANYLINGLALLTIGFFVAFLRPQLKSARALLFLSLSWGASLVIGLADFASFHFRTLLAVAEGFVPATLFYLALCFPNERPLARHRGLLRLVVASSAVLAAMNVLLYDAAPHIWTIAYRAGVIWVAGVILLTLRTTWKERRDSPPIEREKIKIVSLGILTAFALPFLLLGASHMVGAELPLNIVTAGWWIFPATLAYAIVQRDLFEIDVFLRRVATYVALSTAVFALYAAVLALFSQGFYNLGVTTSPWFTLLFSLAVLIAFHPLRDWLQTAVDRLFFRTRFNYAETTRDVSQALNQTLTAEEIAAYVGDVVEQTMAPTNSGLYRTAETGLVAIGDNEQHAIELDEATLEALSHGRILDAGELSQQALNALPLTALLVPLCFEDRLEGALLLGPKNSGATFGPRDVELLRTLANQTAMALRNAASYNRVTELLASLETRVEERTQELQQTQAELRESNVKLRELDRVKTQFFADASHELRTPLTLVLGPLEELGRHSANGGPNGDAPEGWQRLVDLARSNAATLLVLTDTLLDISRIDSGQARPNQRTEALCPLVEATTEPFRWLADQRGVTLSVNCDASLEAWCDRAMMSKILGNLLANALKFTAEGAVEVRAEKGNDAAVVEVSDTGPGIPEDELPFIFDRYRQASTASRSSFAGSGIGLALVRELLELQGGSISVSSAVGRGTTFRLEIPIRATDEVARNADHKGANEGADDRFENQLAALAASSSRKIHLGNDRGDQDRPATETVLVVEDNPEMLDFIRQVVSAPYNVVTAANANAAIAQLRRGGIDLIVSDVMMPGPDGIALCETLKADPDLRHIPLILLTARASLDAKLTGLAAGADDYITKPFHPDELKARISSLMRMREMERQLRRSHEQLSNAYEDLRNAQSQLIHAEKMAALGTLVAGVAHEINNPVSFVHSSIDLIAASIRELQEILERHFDGEGSPDIDSLRTEVGDGERFSTLLENAAICQDGARRAARIVQDLRTFSRPSTNGREPTDLHNSLEQSLRLLQGELKGRITIQRDYGDLPQVRCDPGQIAQVFLNLLANAAQAIQDKGVVTVRTTHNDDRVTVQFSDSGPGMTTETIDKIFDPFFTTKEVGKGTGLGLSIVRSLINSHGGDVHVESTLGEGTTFTVTLPTNGVSHDQLDIPA